VTKLGLLVVITAALAAPAASFAAASTTAPAKTISILVVINDKEIIVAPASGSTTHNGSLGPAPLTGPIPRGDYVSVNVLNTGKKVHNFTIFGKKTKPIKPGGKAHLFVDTIARGRYPWASTLDKGKLFHGSVTVA
jgi:Cupredoxin-like domain